jgi:OmpA-OmpF porin, OOP family
MKLRAALLATALTVATSGVATAQFLGAPGDGVVPRSRVEQMQGPYISLGGGANWLQSTMFEVHDFGPPTDIEKNGFKTGWTANGAIGWAFGIGPRVELEVSYRRNHTNELFEGGACAPSGVDDDFSRLSQLGIMGNIAYDIYTGTRLVPYLGFGGGAVRSSYRVSSDCIFVDDETQWGWAVQGFAGADFLVTDALRLGFRYNFLYTRKLDDISGLECCISAFDEGKLDPSNHAITVQLAYNFGAPRLIPLLPAAPVAAPPPLQRNFLVFFDFDRSDITPEADRVIVQAANNARTAAVTRITLTGHADRSGPVNYNQRLSERRAESVKARLIREGVPAGDIVTMAFGETRPLVPTADGVREPQNRRVEIVF